MKKRLLISFLILFSVSLCSCKAFNQEKDEPEPNKITRGGDDPIVVKYKVNYIVEGKIKTTLSVEANSITNKPDNPQKEGYNFVGWFKDLNDETPFNFDTPITSNLNLYAKFSKAETLVSEYTVYFYSDDTVFQQETVLNNSYVDYPLLDPQKEGYRFVGWFKDLDDKKPFNSNTLITSNLNLYAKYIKLYTPFTGFNVCFYSGDTVFDERLVVSNSTVDYPSLEPQKEGYNFVGWFKDLSLDTPYDFSLPVTNNLNLFAKFVQSDVQINNCSVLFTVDDTTYFSKMVKENEKVTPPQNPQKEGYSFEGWFTNKNFDVKYDFNKNVNNDLILYAKFNKLNEYYLVNYYVDDSLYLSTKAYKNQNINVPLEHPQKEGHYFAGWFTDLDDLESYDFDTAINTSLNLYAKFIKDVVPVKDTTYTIKFYIDDELYDEETVVENNVLESSKVEAYTGYKFLGWYLNLDDDNPFDFETPIESDLVLHAKFTQDIEQYELYNSSYDSLTTVGMTYEILGNVSRKKPTVSNGGLDNYPLYNTAGISDQTIKNNILEENISLLPSSTTFNSLDKDGNLLLDGANTGRKLYKHSASIGLYGNNQLSDRSLSDVSDNEKAVIKKITVYKNKPLNNYITGLYAPAGEVIKVEISEQDLAACGGSITIYIGLTTSRNHANNLGDVAYNRMPRLQSAFTITSPVSYVGSFFGGPIYVASRNPANFSTTISGAVEYLHYIDGITTKAEFERLKNTSAPYFDAETYDLGVRFSGPRYTIFPHAYDTGYTELTYDNFVRAINLWENINILSNNVPKGHYGFSNITMFYDAYIPMKGASAVAIVGTDVSYLPISWMRLSLDYDSFMVNGAWGPIHEFNHHFQKFGANDNNNEVTNNALNYCEYILLTHVTELRNYQNLSHGLGLDSHYGIEYYNKYKDTNTKLNTENGYGLLIQNIGPDAMIRVAQNQGLSTANKFTTPDEFYKALCNTLHMDFTYLIRDLWHLELTESLIEEYQAKNYPTYIPIGSYYSSSFKYLDANNNILLESNHALPYICSDDFTFDLVSDINTISGYSITINKITNPKHGKLTLLDNGFYNYKSTDGQIDSFVVGVTITKGSFRQYVEITYEFNPINTGVEQKTYKFDTDVYNKIEDAISNDFAGTTSVETKYLGNTNGVSGVKKGDIAYVSGKFMITETADYNVTYKGGRGSSVFYGSVNNMNDFVKIGNITINQSIYMFGGSATSHLKMSLNEGDVIYYKLYLLATSDNAGLEIGLSKTDNVKDTVKVDPSLFRGVNASFDENKKEYKLRNTYQREYKNDSFDVNTIGFTVHSDRFVPWDNTGANELDKIFDNNSNTYAHSARNLVINGSNPLDIKIDGKHLFSFNAITLYGNRSGASQLPITFDLYISDDDSNYQLLDTYNNLDLTTSNSIRIKFNNVITTRYIKLIIKKTTPQYFALRDVTFNLEIPHTLITCDKGKYFGNVEAVTTPSTWGHMYELRNGSYLKYDFYGTSALVGLKITADKYKVYLDDNEIELNKIIDLPYSTVYEVEGKNERHELKIVVETGTILVEGFYTPTLY